MWMYLEHESSITIRHKYLIKYSARTYKQQQVLIIQGKQTEMRTKILNRSKLTQIEHEKSRSLFIDSNRREKGIITYLKAENDN